MPGSEPLEVVSNILPFNLMKGLNFLVFRFSSLPLNTGVYIFQVPVSFPLSYGFFIDGGKGAKSKNN